MFHIEHEAVSIAFRFLFQLRNSEFPTVQAGGFFFEKDFEKWLVDVAMVRRLLWLIIIFVKNATFRVHLNILNWTRTVPMTPEMRIKLRTLLIKHEGFRNHLYKDTRGKWTIGVGHNIEDLGLTDQQILSILDDDSASHWEFLSKYPWFHCLSEERQCALIDLAFNVGDKNFTKFSHMIEAIERLDFKIAAEELLRSDYAKQVGQRAIELANILRTSVL